MMKHLIVIVATLLMAFSSVAAIDNDCITFTSAGGFTLKTANLAKNWDVGMQYSTDKFAWTEWNGEEISAAQIGGTGSYNLYMRGDTNTVITGCYKTKRWVLTPTGDNKVACYGNIETLRGATGDEPPTAPMAEGCYHSLFFECTALTTAPSIGVTTMAFGACDCMYAGCSSLTAAPELAPTVVSGNCYKRMFLNCTSLTTASELPATTLGKSCYYEMYRGCTALTNTPALPAITLEMYCYWGMFWGCTSLTMAPALSATTRAPWCYYNMFYGCAALTATIEPQPVEHATFKVYDVYDEVEISAPFVVDFGDTVKVVYTADEGYAFPDGTATFYTNVVANVDRVEVALDEGEQPLAVSTPWKDVCQATGDLGMDISGATANFNLAVTKCYTGIRSVKLEISADNIKYPIDNEIYDVYFNGTKVGRLMGKIGSDFTVTTFTLDPSKVKIPTASGGVANNSLAIKVGACLHTSIKFARLIIEGEVEGISLTASDATDTQGVDVKWDAVPDCTFDLYRSDKLDGEYTRIAQNIPNNIWLDRTAEFGQVYYYYVEAKAKQVAKTYLSALQAPKLTTAVSEVRVSNRDDGRKKSTANTPRIKELKPASLWLTEEGPYNMRIYWEKFDPKEYTVKNIKLELCGGNSANGTKERTVIIENPQIEVDDDGNVMSLDVDLTAQREHRGLGRFAPFGAGEHGSYAISATVVYHDSDGEMAEGPLTSCCVANVYFNKYGKKAKVSNWYRYWIRDQVMPKKFFPAKESEYLYNSGAGTPDDGLFHFHIDGADGGTTYRGMTVATEVQYEIQSEREELPGILKNTRRVKHYWISDYGAAYGDRLELSNNKFVGQFTTGGAFKVAALIAHERKHGELLERLFIPGSDKLVIQGPSTVSLGGIDSIIAYAAEKYGAGEISEPFFRTYYAKITELKQSGNYVIDSDGDGLSDDDERSGIDGRSGFSPSDPDSFCLASINKVESCKTYGDQEALARAAEANPAFDANATKDRDWAFPGSLVGGTDELGVLYAAYFPTRYGGKTGWNEVESSVKDRLQTDCFTDSQLCQALLKLPAGENQSQSLLTESNGEPYDGWSCGSGKLGRLGELSETNHATDYPVQVVDVILSEQTASGLSYAIAVTNLAAQELSVVASGYLMDGASNAVAWAESRGTIPADVSTIKLVFDGKLLAENGSVGYRLFGFKVFDGGDNPNGWSIAHHANIAGDGVYSGSDFTPRAATISDATSAEIIDGDLVASIPLKVCEAGMYTISAAIIDTNRQQICTASISNAFSIGSHMVEMKFSGDEIRRANIGGPYIVTSLEVSRNGEIINSMDGSFESTAYSAAQFGDRTACVLDFGGWRQLDELSYGFTVVNASGRSICYRTLAVLRSANGTPVSTYCQHNVLQPGVNELTISFAGSDLAMSEAVGPYSVKEVAFCPMDDDSAVEEYFPIAMKPIEINKETISPVSLTVTGTPTITAGKDSVFAYLDVPVCVSNDSEVTAVLTIVDSGGKAVVSHKLTTAVSSSGNQTVRFEIPSKGLVATQDGGGTYTICDVAIRSSDNSAVVELPDCSATLASNQPNLSQFLFVLGDDGYILVGTKSTSLSGVIVVPSEYNGKPVVEIGRSVFEDCKSITSVVLPDSIMEVGEGAFSYCTSLASINVTGANQYLTVVDGVLYDKAMTKVLSSIGTITSVNIPNGVRIIEDKAFYGCKSLASVSIPEGVTSIGNYAFEATAMRSVVLPSGLTSIGSRAFAYCTKLETIKIPDSVTSIGWEAFIHCYYLQGPLKLPKDVTVIAAGTFEYCYSLTEIEIPDGVTIIGANAFYTCALYSVTIPRSVRVIGDWAFCGCSLMTSVTMNEGVSEIGDYAFGLCRMTSIALPDTLESIGKCAFDNCTALTSITLPDSLKYLGDNVFNYCTSLTSVTLSHSLKSIGVATFSQCTALTSLTIPDGITEIGKQAFVCCSALESISMSTCVSTIGKWAFAQCSSLRSIVIPDTVTSIGEESFKNCTSLSKVDFEGTPPSGVGNANIPTSATIRYNAKFANEWASVISAYGFTNATPYTPDRYIIPELPDNPTVEQISEALEGSADAKLSLNITDAANYNAYRDWAGKVKGADGEAVGVGAVKNADNAWLSFALGSGMLISTKPVDGDVTVEKFEPTLENGKFDFTVSVKDVTVGDSATKDNLKKVFGLKGGSSLDEMSESNVDITFGTPANGKVTFTAGPNAANADAKTFFMKVKMNP